MQAASGEGDLQRLLLNSARSTDNTMAQVHLPMLVHCQLVEQASACNESKPRHTDAQEHSQTSKLVLR